ncbi:MAG TPA: ABC transporter substrate-binding protein [Acidimicrobiales bacterium]|nr:ABC transporter substrate-binding protein [Acidimicrobiales bacterium]
MTPLRRRLLAMLAILAVLLSACGGDDDDGATGPGDDSQASGEGVREAEEDAPDEGEPQYGGSITIGLEAETNGWLPGTSQPANAGYVVYSAIYDPLVARVEDGSIQPYLAESFEPNEDYTRWSFTLRDGITFHDGTALTAEVIKRNWDEYLTVDGANTKGALEGITVEVTGPLTYDYVLDKGDAAFLDTLTTTPGFPFSVEAAAAAGEDAGSRPVGTGPFVFESWTRDGQLVVTRNEGYWRTDEKGNQLPYLDRITFRPITDEDTRLDSVASGDIDLMQTLRQSIVRRAREVVDGGGFNSYEWLGNNGGAGIINTMKPPFDDVRVRQALVYAVDQEQMIEVLGGTGITPPQTQWFTEDSPWYSEAAADAWIPYDPDKAQELLDSYINDPERSDGQPVGTPIRFTYDCPPDPSLVELSQAYQAFWQQVGLEVNLDSKEQSAHITQGIGTENDPFLRADYDVQCWRLGSEADPYSVWNSAFGPVETEVLNVSDYTHPDITAKLEEMRLEGDLEARKALVEEISLILAEEVPNFWTGGTATAIVAREGVKGILSPTTPDGQEIDGAANAIIRTPFLWLAQ